MATISKLKSEQVVYERRRQKMGNTTVSRTALYSIRIIEVDPEGQFVMAAWNGNIPRKYREADVKKWLVNKPAPSVPKLHAGTLPSINQDAYPKMEGR